MSSFKEKLEKMRMKSRFDRRYTGYYHGDAHRGLEYNSINTNRRVTNKIYQVDLARYSHVIKDFTSRVDVNGEAYKANLYQYLTNYEVYRVKGRRS